MARVHTEGDSVKAAGLSKRGEERIHGDADHLRIALVGEGVEVAERLRIVPRGGVEVRGPIGGLPCGVEAMFALRHGRPEARFAVVLEAFLAGKHDGEQFAIPAHLREALHFCEVAGQIARLDEAENGEGAMERRGLVPVGHDGLELRRGLVAVPA